MLRRLAINARIRFWRMVYGARRAWLAAFHQGRYELVDAESLLDLTTELDEHPDSWDGPCNCATCRSYA